VFSVYYSLQQQFLDSRFNTGKILQLPLSRRYCPANIPNSTPSSQFSTSNSGTQLPILSLSLSLILRPTASRPVCLGTKHPSGAYYQIFITVRHLGVCWCGALSLTRGRVCRLQLLLALASEVIIGSESFGTRDHILPSQIRDFPFRRLLRLARLRWRYSTPPPHRILLVLKFTNLPTCQAATAYYKRNSSL
jgi:hypothetical protein